MQFPFEFDATAMLRAAAADAPGSSTGVSGGPPSDRADRTSRAATSAASNATEDSPEQCLYRLAAVGSHAGGSAQHGHYVAYARGAPSEADAEGPKRPRRGGGSGGWLLFNDAQVQPVSDEAVLRAEAFILLYERQGEGSGGAASGGEGDGVAEGERRGGESGGNDGGGGKKEEREESMEGTALSEDAKKARKLKKLLRQIDELKAALAGRGSEPTTAEKAKLEREAEVRAQLAQLDA